MKLKYFLYASVASCFIHVLVFAFFVHKPLTIGIMQEYYQKKMTYLTNIDSSKIVLLAGSNGRFSHRCETIETEIGIPCVNMSITAGISLDYQFEKLKPFIKPGDILYLPFEYGKLSDTRKDMMSGSEVPYIVAYDHNYILKMDLKRVIYAMFYFDIKFLISSLSEMLLDSKGIKRRFTLDTMTLQGDESQHTLEKAKNYKAYRDSIKWSPPSLNTINENSYGAMIVENFMRWATTNNVTVIGGLPTTFNDYPIPDELISNMQHFYKKRGHDFIVLQNRSQYSREKFYDTSSHLAEEYQIVHSKILANYIKKMLNNQ